MQYVLEVSACARFQFGAVRYYASYADAEQSYYLTFADLMSKDKPTFKITERPDNRVEKVYDTRGVIRDA